MNNNKQQQTSTINNNKQQTTTYIAHDPTDSVHPIGPMSEAERAEKKAILMCAATAIFTQALMRYLFVLLVPLSAVVQVKLCLGRLSNKFTGIEIEL